jgi:hypothetical protein
VSGFWALIFLAMVGLAGWEAKLYYFDPEGTAQKVVDKCTDDADKVFGLEAAKWKIENQTDAFNPYRRERDSAIDNCVAREGSWCTITIGRDVWPCGGSLVCLVPTGTVAHWFYNLKYPDKKGLKCG